MSPLLSLAAHMRFPVLHHEAAHAVAKGNLLQQEEDKQEQGYPQHNKTGMETCLGLWFTVGRIVVYGSTASIDKEFMAHAGSFKKQRGKAGCLGGFSQQRATFETHPNMAQTSRVRFWTGCSGHCIWRMLLRCAMFATPSACYRAPKSQNFPKWLGEGAKGVLVYADQKPVRLVQERVALLQNRVALVQETLGRPFLQLAKTPFAPSPNHFGEFWGVGALYRHLGSPCYFSCTFQRHARHAIISLGKVQRTHVIVCVHICGIPHQTMRKERRVMISSALRTVLFPSLLPYETSVGHVVYSMRNLPGSPMDLVMKCLAQDNVANACPNHLVCVSAWVQQLLSITAVSSITVVIYTSIIVVISGASHLQQCSGRCAHVAATRFLQSTVSGEVRRLRSREVGETLKEAEEEQKG